MVSFLYENCDAISIPMSYIECLDIFDGKIRKIIVNKDFLRECRKFHEFAQYIDDLDYPKKDCWTDMIYVISMLTKKDMLLTI